MENPLADLALSKVSALESLTQDIRRVLRGESRYCSRQNISEHPVLMLESKRRTLGWIDK
jgi:hypothetical protein